MSTSSSATMGSPGSQKSSSSSSVGCNSCSDEIAPKLPTVVANKTYAEVVAANAEAGHHPIYQPFSENEVSKNLAFHVLAATLHLVMMLRETADISQQRNKATAHAAELEAANENLSQEIHQHCHDKQEYESEIERLSIQLNAQRQAIEAIDKKCEELETMHLVKATLLENVMAKLKAANMLLAEASEDLCSVDMEPEANDTIVFWTACEHCDYPFYCSSIVRNLTVVCPDCEAHFVAREIETTNLGSCSSRPEPEGYGNSAGADEV